MARLVPSWPRGPVCHVGSHHFPALGGGKAQCGAAEQSPCAGRVALGALSPCIGCSRVGGGGAGQPQLPGVGSPLMGAGVLWGFGAGGQLVPACGKGCGAASRCPGSAGLGSVSWTPADCRCPWVSPIRSREQQNHPAHGAGECPRAQCWAPACPSGSLKPQHSSCPAPGSQAWCRAASAV